MHLSEIDRAYHGKSSSVVSNGIAHFSQNCLVPEILREGWKPTSSVFRVRLEPTDMREFNLIFRRCIIIIVKKTISPLVELKTRSKKTPLNSTSDNMQLELCGLVDFQDKK